MEFDTDSESENRSRLSPRSSDKPSLDFGLNRRNTLASQRKLMMLVLLLIGVIYAMIEAGKPERWHWLLPPKSRPTDTQRQPITIEILEPRTTNETNLESRQQVPDTFLKLENERIDADADQTSNLELSGDSGLPPTTKLPTLIQPNSTAYPNAAFRFWSDALRQLSSDQRRDLFWLIKRARQGQTLSADQAQVAEQLLTLIRAKRIKFHQNLLDNVTYSKAGADEKAKLANDHFEAETTWDRGEWPALSSVLAGETLNAQQNFSLQRLQTVLDRLMLDFVEDRTAQGWEGDSPAWGRMWERLMFEKLPPSTPVTHLELSAQAPSYRNQPVQVRGWVRGAWKERLPIRELGIENLFVLAVRPEDSKVTPYFLYLREQPPGFPPLTRDFQHFNQRIVGDGLFFKIRTYLDTEQKVQYGPMILIDSLRLESALANLPQTDSRQWMHPLWLVLAAIILPALAAGVAWFAFRSTQIRRFQPGPNRTREIRQELDQLANHSEIKTAQERVRELYD